MTVKRGLLSQTQQVVIGRRRPHVSLFYDRIMVSTILKRVVAFTACGFSAGNRTTSPVLTSDGLASNGNLCFAFNSLHECVEWRCVFA